MQGVLFFNQDFRPYMFYNLAYQKMHRLEERLQRVERLQDGRMTDCWARAPMSSMETHFFRNHDNEHGVFQDDIKQDPEFAKCVKTFRIYWDLPELLFEPWNNSTESSQAFYGIYFGKDWFYDFHGLSKKRIPYPKEDQMYLNRKNFQAMTLSADKFLQLAAQLYLRHQEKASMIGTSVDNISAERMIVAQLLESQSFDPILNVNMWNKFSDVISLELVSSEITWGQFDISRKRLELANVPKDYEVCFHGIENDNAEEIADTICRSGFDQKYAQRNLYGAGGIYLTQRFSMVSEYTKGNARVVILCLAMLGKSKYGGVKDQRMSPDQHSWKYDLQGGRIYVVEDKHILPMAKIKLHVR